MGVSQAERQEKGPGCECCAMTGCLHINTYSQKQLHYIPVKYLLSNRPCACSVCLQVFGLYPHPHPHPTPHPPSYRTTWTGGVKLQPVKPHLSRAQVKVEGKNGWLAPTQAMSTQQLSIFPYTTSPHYFFLHTEFTQQFFVVFYHLALMMGEFDLRKKKEMNKAQTGTLRAHVVENWLTSQLCLQAEVCRTNPNLKTYAQSVPCHKFK